MASVSVIIMTKIAYLLSALLTSLVVHTLFHSKHHSSSSYSTSWGTEQSDFDSNAQVQVPVVVLPEKDHGSTSGMDDEGDEESGASSPLSSSSSSSSSSSLSYTQEALADRITNLPGLTFTPSFEQFSGYIDVSPTRKIHYWYIESMNDPSNDPVVYWTNGGPGCSGLLGLGTEMGPFIFESGGKLSLNPFTWNNIANILYVEQPAGVGFSYFTDPVDNNVGDERSAADNYRLIQGFFERFPERKGNDFYIASESYGGHYIPHLAKTILGNNIDNAINFRGWLVGNPYVDLFSNDATMIQTWYMHGLVPMPLYSRWEQSCLDRNKYDPDKCKKLVDAMMGDAGKGINPYAVDYPACVESDNNDYTPQAEEEDATIMGGNGAFTTIIKNNHKQMRITSSSQSSQLLNATSIKSPPFLPKEDVYHPCAEAHLFTYLNRDDVKEALHVNTDRDWSECSDNINYSTEDKDKTQIYLYEELIEVGKKAGSDLKMMVFSGDDDSICSTASTQYWIWGLTDPILDKFWQPWHYQNQTVGYITHFDLGEDSKSSFIFVTVHGAGHEVPAYRPAEALAMFSSYLNGKWDVKSSL